MRAYAKLNLFLDILARRADGYHDLRMVMQSVDLADDLTLQPGEGIWVDCKGFAQENNSAYAAARAFFGRTGIAGGAHIHIHKRIPAEAGLGGGSADAAATLVGLNALFGSPLPDSELHKIACTLGADVPFALVGGCKRAQGTGDILEEIPNRMDCVYLLAKPWDGVSTAEAFALHDRLGGACALNAQACENALACGDLAAFGAHTGNALQTAAAHLCPAVGELLASLGACPHVQAVFMTGSGSACVGVFAREDEARAAARLLTGDVACARVVRGVGQGVSFCK